MWTLLAWSMLAFAVAAVAAQFAPDVQEALKTSKPVSYTHLTLPTKA